MLDELDNYCAVCQRSLGATPLVLGERTYCEEHLHKVFEDRPSVWRTARAQLVVLPVLLVAVLIVTRALNLRLTGGLLVPSSILVAVLPGLSWLGLVYVQERRSGGATQFLPTVVILGALVATALGLPFLQQVASINIWLPSSSLTGRYLGSLLLVGPTHMFLIYAVVRYTVFHTPFFERRVDGIFFAVAAAVGYASMLNVQLAVNSGGFDAASGVFRVVGDVVGHAGAAAVLGLFLGRFRLEHMPFWYLPAGLLLAAFVDGTMVYSRAEINRTSLSLTQDAFSPWPGLFFSFFIAAAAFVTVYMLLRRLNTLTQARYQ